MSIDLLLQEAKGMNDYELTEVIHFMQFLKIAPINAVDISTSSEINKVRKTYRNPGLYKGKIKLSDNFDKPLDDFEEYI